MKIRKKNLIRREKNSHNKLKQNITSNYFIKVKKYSKNKKHNFLGKTTKYKLNKEYKYKERKIFSYLYKIILNCLLSFEPLINPITIP